MNVIKFTNVRHGCEDSDPLRFCDEISYSNQVDNHEAVSLDSTHLTHYTSCASPTNDSITKRSSLSSKPVFSVKRKISGGKQCGDSLRIDDRLAGHISGDYHERQPLENTQCATKM